MEAYRKPQVEDPHPDFMDVIEDRSFHGVVWMPTVLLRFVEREIYHPIDPHHEDIETIRVLQQMWETGIVNNSGTMKNVVNPGKRQWRDVPTHDEEELLWPTPEPDHPRR